MWTTEIFTYQRSPECPCRGRFVRCVNGRCVAKLRRPPKINQVRRIPMAMDFPSGSSAHTFISSDDPAAIVPTKDTCSKVTCPNEGRSIQNTFSIDHMVNPDDWVYMPFKVVYQRRGAMTFSSFSLDQGQVDSPLDIFDISRSPELRNLLPQGQLGTYPHCKVSGAGNIKVGSNRHNTEHQ